MDIYRDIWMRKMRTDLLQRHVQQLTVFSKMTYMWGIILNERLIMKLHFVVPQIKEIWEDRYFLSQTNLLAHMSNLDQSQSLKTPLLSHYLLTLLHWPIRKVYSLFFKVTVSCFHNIKEILSFNGLEYKFNKWNTVCATWNGSTGMSQMVINNTPSVRKAALEAPLMQTPV